MSRASDIQRINAALEQLEPQFRAAFLRAVNDMRSNAQIAVVAKAIEEGRVADAIAALNVDPAFWAPLDDMLKQAYIQGGRDAIAALPVIPDPAGLGKS